MGMTEVKNAAVDYADTVPEADRVQGMPVVYGEPSTTPSASSGHPGTAGVQNVTRVAAAAQAAAAPTRHASASSAGFAAVSTETRQPL